MDSLSVLKYPFFVLRLSGAWYPENVKPVGKYLYFVWTIVNVFVFGLLFSMIEILNVFFVASIDVIVVHLMISSTVFVAVFKAYFVLVNRERILKLFKLIRELDRTVGFDETQETFKPIHKFSKLLFACFGCCYLSCLSVVWLHTIFSSPADRFYSSTYLYPYKFLHKPMVYQCLLIFQMLANGTSCFMDIGLDTYGIILVFILYGHFDVLAKKLSSLGDKDTQEENYLAVRTLITQYKTMLE